MKKPLDIMEFHDNLEIVGTEKMKLLVEIYCVEGRMIAKIYARNILLVSTAE